MANSSFIDKIDAYLDGELSVEEREAFEAAVSTDTELEKEVRKNLVLRRVLQQAHQQDLRAQIRQWRNQETAPRKQARLYRLSSRLVVAASILLLIGFTVFYWAPARFSNDALLNTYYTPDPELIGGLRSATTMDPLQQAKNAYQQGNFQKAVSLFQQFPNNDKALIGLAHSYYQSGDFPAAIRSFQQLIDHGDPEYVEKAEWYLLLSLLANNLLDDRFDQLIEKIISDGGYYSAPAQRLQRNLNSFWRKL